MHPSNLQQSKILKEEIAFEKKWFGIKRINFTIGDKTIENYEASYRPNRKSNFNLDGVEILPIIKKKDKTLQIVMIANFRPPIGKFCLEFPGGLVEDSNYEENAIRELKQQTGYTGQKIIKIPQVITHCDPWKSNEGGLLYIVFINQQNPNHFQKQHLESEQNIRVFTFKLDDHLPSTINDFAEKQGYGIHGRTWSIILGLNLHHFL